MLFRSTALPTVPDLRQDHQQSTPQRKSTEPGGSNTPTQLLTPVSTPSPPPMSTPELEIQTPEADSDGAASEGVEYRRDQSPVTRTLDAGTTIVVKTRKAQDNEMEPQRARNDGINPQNVITGPRTRKSTEKGKDYTATRRGKHMYEVSQNSSNLAYLAAFHTGLKHRLHRRNMPPEPKSWKHLQSHPYRAQFMQAAQAEMDQH